MSLSPEEVAAREKEKPLTIAMVVDSIGNRGNGTSNSALQYAEELRAQGHTVRFVGIGAPEYRARIHHIPLVSFIAAKQQMAFAQPSEDLFDRAFDGVDVVHIYLPFKFGREAMKAARARGIAVTAGFHLQPENVTYSAGLQRIPGLPRFIYWLFRKWFYRRVDHVHVPTQCGAELLRKHHYENTLHVISNGYEPRFTPRGDSYGEKAEETEAASNAGTVAESAAGVEMLQPDIAELGMGVREDLSDEVGQTHEFPTLRRPFRIVASGRLSNEKDHVTLLKAVALSRYSEDIEVSIAGQGPLKRRLRRYALRFLDNPAVIGFHPNAHMPEFLRSGDLFVHPSIADLESLSVIEAMAVGLVPVIADSPLSAAGQFSLCEESSFPVQDAQALADRIDWWIEHPRERRRWGGIYARHTLENYSVRASIRKFVQMEREAIADA
ncbi:MAG: glycosyltransferase [Bifidobacteriaceae bacterium]|jgi:glycosyltransferase involved in cell wall biosynthesis|nr:glycosyltransferase [Bifidobacteriaceae bacterium]MCI1978396.1 glycosyltransferase [Bifidobacteriaceae bacterium]